MKQKEFFRRFAEFVAAVMIAVFIFGGSVFADIEGEGNSNTLFGQAAGNSLGDDDDANTFIGRSAGYNTLDGAQYNTFIGHSSGVSNTGGFDNTFLGFYSGYNNTTGNGNTFLGKISGYSNTTGYTNTFIGDTSGYFNTTGNTNTFLGGASGYSNSTGSGNVFLGYNAGFNETGSNKLYIDNSDTTTPLIYGEFDNNILQVNGELRMVNANSGIVRLSNVTTNNTTKGTRMVLTHYTNAELPVYLFGAASTSTDNFVAFGGGNAIGNAATQIDLFTGATTTTQTGTSRMTVKSNGNIGMGTQGPAHPLHMASGAHVTAGGTWTNASSREYKENIESLKAEEAIEALKKLEPVKFTYKADKEERHTGFIAEDVPELVATKDRKGLSPMDIVAVLTKVVQEQEKKIQGQAELIEVQQEAITGLTAELQDIKRMVRMKGALSMSLPVTK